MSDRTIVCYGKEKNKRDDSVLWKRKEQARKRLIVVDKNRDQPPLIPTKDKFVLFTLFFSFLLYSIFFFWNNLSCVIVRFGSIKALGSE